eukprot:gnl/TRDRNA2_/TRDRNA2_175358_c6_seq12.p1 gnl/TRDRNA2_/TRDRNA2_175358_c6~~gnl/TRDRNA2_/TRDRNA2_175358_c6_seq12.p1  ORF type:complete len:110 (+),score=10.43 gnl/TRDRNA2_/TRDRNA2_175358_c6_seq12:57-386(+)
MRMFASEDDANEQHVPVADDCFLLPFPLPNIFFRSYLSCSQPNVAHIFCAQHELRICQCALPTGYVMDNFGTATERRSGNGSGYGAEKLEASRKGFLAKIGVCRPCIRI